RGRDVDGLLVPGAVPIYGDRDRGVVGGLDRRGSVGDRIRAGLEIGRRRVDRIRRRLRVLDLVLLSTDGRRGGREAHLVVGRLVHRHGGPERGIGDGFLDGCFRSGRRVGDGGLLDDRYRRRRRVGLRGR